MCSFICKQVWNCAFFSHIVRVVYCSIIEHKIPIISWLSITTHKLYLNGPTQVCMWPLNLLYHSLFEVFWIPESLHIWMAYQNTGAIMTLNPLHSSIACLKYFEWLKPFIFEWLIENTGAIMTLNPLHSSIACLKYFEWLKPFIFEWVYQNPGAIVTIHETLLLKDDPFFYIE